MKAPHPCTILGVIEREGPESPGGSASTPTSLLSERTQSPTCPALLHSPASEHRCADSLQSSQMQVRWGQDVLYILSHLPG